MIQDIRKETDDKVSVKGREKTADILCTQMIKLILEKNAERKRQLLFKLQAEMEEHILPQRKLLGTKRKRNILNKYKNNQKSSLKKVHTIPLGKVWTFFLQYSFIMKP